MTRDEINKLQDKYFEKEKPDYNLLDGEQRLDEESSKILYSFIRKVKPQVCLEFGTSWGGSPCVIIAALLKNEQSFKYIGFEKVPGLLQAAASNIVRKYNFTPELYADITQNVDKIPEELDFVFIDPDWEEDIAIWTFENIIPRVKKGGLVCIHDWSVDEEYVYGGGSFEGIKYFIKLFQEEKMPLEKIFNVWDEEDYRLQSRALSFWRKL